MCNIGAFVSHSQVPEGAAVTAIKWAYLRDDGTFEPLVSEHHRGYRVGRRYVAVCKCSDRVYRHAPASIFVSCGFYADVKYHPNAHPYRQAFVVALWGRVAVHKDGYRASQMRLLHEVEGPCECHPELFT